MKIYKKEHKSILNTLFFHPIVPGQPVKQKNFPLDQLGAAGSAFTKIRDGADEKTGVFNQEEISFDLNEILVLKRLFDEASQEGFGAADAQFVLELKDKFDGKGEDLSPIPRAEVKAK